MAADGTITIDTRIDASGINTGVKTMTSSLGKVLSVVKLIGKALVAAFIGGNIINALRGIVGSFDIMKSSVADKFKPLSDALATLKGAFINLLITAIVPLIPYIVTAVQWFTNLLFTVTKLIGALFGIKKTMGGIATETKKATKETKGALAAFDQINVLQSQQDEEEGTGFITPEAMIVPDSFIAAIEKIKEIVEAIKKEILEWWADPIGKIQETWGEIVDWFRKTVIAPLQEWWGGLWSGTMISKLWENWKNTWAAIVENTVGAFQTIKENAMLYFKGVIEYITGVFTGDWALAWQGIKDMAAGAFGALWAIITSSLKNWSILISGIGEHFRIIFGPTLDWVASKFVEVFGRIRDFVMGVISNIIGFIQGMIASIMDGIAAVSGLLGVTNTGIGGASASANLRPPGLATGAVIPPNARFAAILGDQKSGRNLEAPEGLIRQIMREEMQGMGGEMTVNMPVYLDGELVYRNQKKVSTRHGKSLIAGNR